MVSENNKRIAKNTMLLYTRTLFSQLLALYTSRKILEIIGIEDFGIYNVVGGVTGLLTFLNGSMAVATQRFLTIELGKNDLNAYNRVFCMAYIIHIALAFVILLIAETIGLWFVNHCLNIPDERMVAANWIYQTSIAIMMLSIIQTPYIASLTAHERMGIYAYVGMGESILRLAVVFLLLITSHDKLIVYGFMLLSIQLIAAMVYRGYCVKHFPECKYKWTWNKKLFHSLLGFTSWNLFGTIAWILKDQGNNMLMNIFGNPLINAARGVSYQVSNAVQNLVNGFSTAVNPQLTKNYATDNREGLHKLMMLSSKLSFFLLLFLALPIIIEISYILDLWLVEVPTYSTLFTRIILVESLCATLGGPMITSLLATGHIKWYQIVVGSVMLLNVPISYLLLYIGFPIETPIIVSLIITSLCFVLRLWFCKYQLTLSIRTYLRSVIVPTFAVAILSSFLPIFASLLMDEGFLRLFITIVISTISVSLCTYFIGLSRKEQLLVRDLIGKRFKRNIQ